MAFNQQELERDLRLDKMHLDDAAEAQADLRYKWGARLVASRAILDSADAELVQTEATIKSDILLDPGAYDLSTEKAPSAETVKQTARSTKKYKLAVQTVLDARRDVGLLEQAVFAISDKRGMIEAATKLYVGQYFAGPNINGDGKRVDDRPSRIKGRKRRAEADEDE